MKIAVYYFGFLASLLIVVMGVGFLTGCEDVNATSTLTVEPASYTFPDPDNPDINSAIFTVTGGMGGDGTNGNSGVTVPLEWSVSSPKLGNIISSDGRSAVYQRSHYSGDNVIMVKHKYDGEGFAKVSQSGEMALIITPSECSLAAAEYGMIFTVESSLEEMLPIKWWVSDTSLGSVISSEGYSAVYARTTNSGCNAIMARDGIGREGVAVINQE